MPKKLNKKKTLKNIYSIWQIKQFYIFKLKYLKNMQIDNKYRNYNYPFACPL